MQIKLLIVAVTCCATSIAFADSVSDLKTAKAICERHMHLVGSGPLSTRATAYANDFKELCDPIMSTDVKEQEATQAAADKKSLRSLSTRPVVTGVGSR